MGADVIGTGLNCPSCERSGAARQLYAELVIQRLAALSSVPLTAAAVVFVVVAAAADFT